MANTFRRDIPNRCLYDCNFVSLSKDDNQLMSHSGPRIQSIIVQGIMILWWNFPLVLTHCFLGFLRSSYRRHVVPLFLQYNQHQHLTHGNPWDRICLEIHTFAFVLNCGMTVSDLVASGASMTLIGLLPPLCENGNMLVDGGYSTCNTFLVWHLSQPYFSR